MHTYILVHWVGRYIGSGKEGHWSLAAQSDDVEQLKKFASKKSSSFTKWESNGMGGYRSNNSGGWEFWIMKVEAI